MCLRAFLYSISHMFITQLSYNLHEIESMVGRQVLITFRYINGKAHSEISAYGN
jgi:hypothetical protein